MHRLALPVRSIPIGSEVELRVEALQDPAEHDHVMVDVRLARRSPADTSDGAMIPTAAGFRVPLHLSGLVAEAIRHVGTRAAHVIAMAPEAEHQPAKASS